MRFPRIVVLLAALTASAWLIPQTASAQQVSVNFQLFYDELSPYGSWVDYPNRGYVWIPDGDPGFSPYATSGHWVFTEDGWTWFSDYPWGWAPFHYGRWDYDDAIGWYWVPDNEWGPAWVTWRRSPGYYGWAPLRPGISISIAFGSDYHERNERWIFVRERDITRPDVSRRYVARSNNVTIIRRSTVIVNTRQDSRRNATYIAGPDKADVQKATRSTVRPVAIRENARPGHQLEGGELHIYRPLVEKRTDNGKGPAPSRVVRLDERKASSDRNAGDRQRAVQPAKTSTKEQRSQSRVATPSTSREKAKQPQKVAAPGKNRTTQPSQPKSAPSGREKRKRGT